MDRRFRFLPLLLLAAMLLIAVAIEQLGFGSVLWLPKLPFALLLGLALARGLRGGAADRP